MNIFKKILLNTNMAAIAFTILFISMLATVAVGSVVVTSTLFSLTGIAFIWVAISITETIDRRNMKSNAEYNELIKEFEDIKKQARG